jgi:hypothetical protein
MSDEITLGRSRRRWEDNIRMDLREEALRRADTPSKESYQLSNRFISFRK